MLKHFVKRLAHPLRTFLGRAVILPAEPLPLNWTANMSLIEKVAALVSSDKIEGDYLEFGVFRGGSFSQSYRALKRLFEDRIKAEGLFSTPEDARERQEIWDRMRFFAFDSFEGLPELKGVDTQTRDFARGQYAAGIDEFLGNVTRDGVPAERVVCVPGWFEETCVPATIEKYQLKKAAVIWVDCDLYHSTRSVLEFITPLLQDGTVIIFDDWYNFRGNPRLGEQRAFAEWKETLRGFTFSEYQKEGAWRNSFLVSSILPEADDDQREAETSAPHSGQRTGSPAGIATRP